MISNFLPKQKLLFENEDGVLDCPFEGMEEVWVRVIPPTWETDMQRATYMSVLAKSEDSTNFDIIQKDLWLTYGGSNMSLIVQKKDEHGHPLWISDDDDNILPDTETITFDTVGALSEEEFYKRLARVPSVIIDYWYSRVLEVAKQWSTFFRR